MTLQEILKAKGMADDVIDVIMGEMKQNSIFTTKEENMDTRYAKLKRDFDALTTQHGEATNLIEQLKTDAQNNEAITAKVTAYEQQIANLTQQLNEQKIDSAMDRKLTSAGAKSDDLDYLKFQWRKKGEITLDDNGEIKGGDDVISGLKTQHPVQFESKAEQRELQPHELHDRNDGDKTITKEEFEKMGYNSRVKLKEENPELYTKLMKG